MIPIAGDEEQPVKCVAFFLTSTINTTPSQPRRGDNQRKSDIVLVIQCLFVSCHRADLERQWSKWLQRGLRW
jgi:hypothetical protein